MTDRTTSELISAVAVTVRRTSTRRSSKRDQLSCHCPNVTVLVTPRAHYRVAGPRTSRREQLKVPLDNMHATG